MFATPLLQNPLELGADCVVYSATKHIDGQGRCLGGVILGSREVHRRTTSTTLLRQTGPSLSPFNAWVLLKGLETLPLRVRAADRQRGDGRRSRSPSIRRSRALIYPGRPDHPQAEIVAAADDAAARRWSPSRSRAARRRRSASRTRSSSSRISNNLGDAKSLITHPATTTHQRLTPEQRAELGISDGLVRLSVGLEHPDDIVEDLLTALEAA